MALSCSSSRWLLPALAALLAGCATDAVTGPALAPEGAAAPDRVVSLPSGSIRIRCAFTVTPPADPPLVIVDGVVRKDGALREVDPLSLESIDVLKGPAAVERYGPDARHGVILVRTKAGVAPTPGT